MITDNINGINKTTNSNDLIYNPKSKLDKDAFLKLFIKQLELQDPTDPMDTEKMLEQTSYLSTMEMNENMQNTLNSLSQKLQTQSQLNTISAIGKMADTGNRYLNVSEDDTSKSFELYFGDDIENGDIIIKDKNGNIIKEFPLESHKKGILSFDWDLKDNNGKRVKEGAYEIIAKYTSPDKIEHQTSLGAYPIESVRFENGKAYAKLGSQYIPFDEIKEIYEWQG